ncbi:hypothetical protein [Arthrobacter sp. UYCu712]
MGGAVRVTQACLAGLFEFGDRLDVWSVHPGILKTGMGRSGAVRFQIS